MREILSMRHITEVTEIYVIVDIVAEINEMDGVLSIVDSESSMGRRIRQHRPTSSAISAWIRKHRRKRSQNEEGVVWRERVQVVRFVVEGMGFMPVGMRVLPCVDIGGRKADKAIWTIRNNADKIISRVVVVLIVVVRTILVVVISDSLVI